MRETHALRLIAGLHRLLRWGRNEGYSCTWQYILPIRSSMKGAPCNVVRIVRPERSPRGQFLRLRIGMQNVIAAAWIRYSRNRLRVFDRQPSTFFHARRDSLAYRLVADRLDDVGITLDASAVDGDRKGEYLKRQRWRFLPVHDRCESDGNQKAESASNHDSSPVLEKRLRVSPTRFRFPPWKTGVVGLNVVV